MYIANCTHQQGAIDLPLDQIVLRPPLHGLNSERLIVHTRKHNNGNSHSLILNLDNGLKPLAVRQQNASNKMRYEATFTELLHRFAEPFDMCRFKLIEGCFH